MCEKFYHAKAAAKSVIPWEDGKPYKQWAINVVGPMPSNNQGTKYLITPIDFYTQWPIACAVKIHNSKAIAWFIGQEISAKFGNPWCIMTDQGHEFMSKDMKVYSDNYKIDHLPTTPYYAQANW